MAEKTVNFFQKTKKCPFGIICGSCGIAVFYSIIGLVLAYYVTAGIAAQTSRTVSFLENWWQVLIFVVALIAACVAIASFVLYILKKSALIKARDPIYFTAVEGEDETEETAELPVEQHYAAELAACKDRIFALETELASVKTELERLRKSDVSTRERTELDKIREQLKQMLEQKRKVDEIAALESEIKESTAYVAEQRREKEKRRLAALERRQTSKSKESRAPTTKEKIDGLKREIDELRALLTANKGGEQ